MLRREFINKPFLTGFGEQLLRTGQGTVAVAGLDAYFKSPTPDFDIVRAVFFVGLGCFVAVLGVYVKSKGDRL